MSNSANKPYEFVELPSKGLCYHENSPLRVGRVAMDYLTAKDENFLLNLALNKSNDVRSFIQSKIVDTKISVDDICRGDLDAIFIWLRKTGYGDDFIIDVTDVNSEKSFTTAINLSDVKNNDFDVCEDGDGNFMYFMKNGDILSYRIIGYYKLESLYEEISEKTDKQEETLDFLLGNYTVSVNGNKDTNFIKNYIKQIDMEEKVLYWLYINDSSPSVNNALTVNIQGKDTDILLKINSDFLIM
jgi:hypothetical protein